MRRRKNEQKYFITRYVKWTISESLQENVGASWTMICETAFQICYKFCLDLFSVWCIYVFRIFRIRLDYLIG
jgi:hypothetical protein